MDRPRSLPKLANAAAICGGLCAVLVFAGPAMAASSVELPSQACRHPALSVFASGFEQQPWQPVPSLGSGGASGSSQRLTSGPSPVSYFAHAPASRAAAAPLMLVLHGAGGPGTAVLNAMATRDAWVGLAEARGFVVAAPIASGSQGGWVPSSDFAAIDRVLADMQSAYDLDRSRVYLWGFSAGGHIAHTLALLRNPDRHAAYAVNAGVLEGHAGPQAAATSPRRVPLISSVGDADPLLSFAQADRQRFLSAGWTDGLDYRLRVFSGGHEYTTADLAAAYDFQCHYGLLPPLE